MITLYLTRPNVISNRLIERQLEAILPKKLDSRFAIGMPLRGSDKCGKESNCLRFDEYMEVAKEAWEEIRTAYNKTSSKSSKVIIPARPSLIVTTEDRKIFDQMLNYSSNGSRFDFVANENDVMQSSGHFGEIARSTKEDPDQILLSSLIAMKMQLHARFVYGNCCSNFHNLLLSFLRLGCGVHQEPGDGMTRRCYPNICCTWTRKSDCEKIRAEYNQTLMARKAKISADRV